MVDPLAKKKLVNAAQDGDVSAVIKFIKESHIDRTYKQREKTYVLNSPLQ